MDYLPERRYRRTILRYFLVVLLVEADRPLSIAELVDRLASEPVAVPGRPSKTVSDSLRWEARKGRVVRLGHSSYYRGTIPRTTLRRMRERVARLRDGEPRGMHATAVASHTRPA
jgi:hypothetical protein